jgi:hypothetical protein
MPEFISLETMCPSNPLPIKDDTYLALTLRGIRNKLRELISANSKAPWCEAASRLYHCHLFELPSSLSSIPDDAPPELKQVATRIQTALRKIETDGSVPKEEYQEGVRSALEHPSDHAVICHICHETIATGIDEHVRICSEAHRIWSALQSLSDEIADLRWTMRGFVGPHWLAIPGMWTGSSADILGDDPAVLELIAFHAFTLLSSAASQPHQLDAAVSLLTHQLKNCASAAPLCAHVERARGYIERRNLLNESRRRHEAVLGTPTRAHTFHDYDVIEVGADRIHVRDRGTVVPLTVWFAASEGDDKDRLEQMWSSLSALSGVPRVLPFHLRAVCTTHAALVTPYHPGTLGSLINGYSPLSEQLAVYVMSELLTVCCALHERGYYFGDVRPEDILIAKDGTIQIYLVRKRRDLLQALKPSRYSAPEQLTRHGAGEFTEWAAEDLWRIGVIAYEVRTGRPLFARPRFERKIAKWNGPTRDQLDAFSKPTQAILSGLLAKDPAHRGTAEGWLRNLESEDSLKAFVAIGLAGYTSILVEKCATMLSTSTTIIESGPAVALLRSFRTKEFEVRQLAQLTLKRKEEQERAPDDEDEDIGSPLADSVHEYPAQ